MSAKKVIRRATAHRDIDAIVDHYCESAGERVALDFVDALEQALAHIGSHPATGSPRYAHLLDLPGLRAWQLRRFPQLVFYFDNGETVEVWHVLHGSMDLPEWLD